MGYMSKLPFERGTYTCGTVEVGAEFYDPSNKQHLQIVKNTDAAAVLPKRMLKWETPASYACDYAVTAANGIMAAGIVDPQLASTGCPVNAYCYIVVAGVVTADVGSGNDIAAAGELVIMANTAIAANKGKINARAAVSTTLTAELAEQAQVVGVSHAAALAATGAAVSTQIRLNLRK